VQAVVFELIKLGQSGFLNRVKWCLTQTFYKEGDFPSNVRSKRWFYFGCFRWKWLIGEPGGLAMQEQF